MQIEEHVTDRDKDL